MTDREDIRNRLKKHQLTQVWLINQLSFHGIITDKTEMSSVLSGARSAVRLMQSSNCLTTFLISTKKVLFLLSPSDDNSNSENGRKRSVFPTNRKSEGLLSIRGTQKRI